MVSAGGFEGMGMIPTFASGASAMTVGRYHATEQEVHQRFVADPQFAASSTRAALWDEWKQASDLLRNAVPVAHVWLAGSFTTSKLDPNDIDCLFWLDHEKVAALTDPAARNVVSVFATPNALKTATGLRIDSYVSMWRPIPLPAAADVVDLGYYQNRGHWDDFWQRQRVSTLGAAPTREDSIQRRGYLEVTLDGF